MAEILVEAPTCPMCDQRHWGPCSQRESEFHTAMLQCAEEELTRLERECDVIRATIASLRSSLASNLVRPTESEGEREKLRDRIAWMVWQGSPGGGDFSNECWATWDDPIVRGFAIHDEAFAATDQILALLSQAPEQGEKLAVSPEMLGFLRMSENRVDPSTCVTVWVEPAGGDDG